MRLVLHLLIVLLGSTLMIPAEGETPPPPAPSYGDLLRELKPRMVFEVTEPNMNAYLGAHVKDFAIPEGFTSPYVAFGSGLIEVSALTRVLFVPTRVRVSMRPQVVRGRLHLRVDRIHAGPLPLPSSFHHGTAETIAGVINEILDRNEVQLLAVEASRGLIRVTAQAGPVPPCPPEDTGSFTED